MLREAKPRRAGRPLHPVSRDDLLAVARVAFAEAGYAGATMGDIATRAGIRKASLFHHFRSKETLYLETLSAITDDLVKLVIAADLGSGSFLERIDRLGGLVRCARGAHDAAVAERKNEGRDVQ